MSNLVIPVDRDMVVMHTGNQPDSVGANLRISVDESEPIEVGIEVGEQAKRTNPRAQRAIVLLTGIYFAMFGEVTIFDLDDDTIRHIMEDAS